MKGFKNSTRTQYYKGGEAKGYSTGGAAYGPPANPAPPPPPPTDNRHRLVSLGDAPAPMPSSGGASISVGRVGRGVTGGVPGSKTAGKGYGGTARVPFAKGGSVKGAAKISKVMGEFKAGTLHSGSKKGPEVTSKKQATAIALSEARKAGAKIPMKKAQGGSAEADDVLLARMSKDELAMGAKGLKMARERMAKDRVNVPARKGVPVDSRKAMIGGREAADTYMARLPRGAVRAAEPAIPSYKPGSRSGLKGGGLAVMPKGKGGKC